jgi:hypothetical protein
MNSHESLHTLSRLEFSTSHKTARTICGIFGEKFAVVICIETLEALMSMVVNVPIVVSSSKLGRKEKMDQLNSISFNLIAGRSRLEFSPSHKTVRTIRGIFGEKIAVLICVETLEALMSMIVDVPKVVLSRKVGRKEQMDQLNAISFLLQFFFQCDRRSGG